MKRIAIVSGARSEYGLLRPLITRLQTEKKFILQLVITGSHLEKKFGETVKEVSRDFKIDQVLKLSLKKDTNKAMSILVGNAIVGFTPIFSKLHPSLLLVLGDRVETFGAVVAAYYMNIPIAHIHGGDRTIGGSLDDFIRHAITKLAHIHLAATDQSAERIIKMGEEPWRVHVVGALGVEAALPVIKRALRKKQSNKRIFLQKIQMDPCKPLAVLLQHSVTTEVSQADAQIQSTLEAIKALQLQTVIIYPNADAGGRRIIEVIEQYRKYPFVKIYKSLAHHDFVVLLSMADLLLGNSSAGIIESPVFKIPCINIGSRQRGRERGSNVIDADYDTSAIKKMIKKALSLSFRKQCAICKNPYGKGRASENIIKILHNVNIDDKLLQKKITY